MTYAIIFDHVTRRVQQGTDTENLDAMRRLSQLAVDAVASGRVPLLNQLDGQLSALSAALAAASGPSAPLRRAGVDGLLTVVRLGLALHQRPATEVRPQAARQDTVRTHVVAYLQRAPQKGHATQDLARELGFGFLETNEAVAKLRNDGILLSWVENDTRLHGVLPAHARAQMAAAG